MKKCARLQTPKRRSRQNAHDSAFATAECGKFALWITGSGAEPRFERCARLSPLRVPRKRAAWITVFATVQPRSARKDALVLLLGALCVGVVGARVHVCACVCA